MPPASGAVQLFVDQNYSGASLTLAEGSYNVDRLATPDAVGNDTVSSLLGLIRFDGHLRSGASVPEG